MFGKTLLNDTFSLFDKAYAKFFSNHKQNEYEFFEIREQLLHKENILYDMSAINDKCSALLTHISIMIGMLGVFISAEHTHGMKYFFMAELIGYVLIAVVLLRSLDIMGPPFKLPPCEQDDLKNFYCSEISLRRNIYARGLRWTFILTILLIPIFIFGIK